MRETRSFSWVPIGIVSLLLIFGGLSCSRLADIAQTELGAQEQTDIRNEVVTAENADTLYERAKKELSYEEFELLQSYLRRVHPDLPEGRLPVGVPVGVMIESQRAYVAAQPDGDTSGAKQVVRQAAVSEPVSSARTSTAKPTSSAGRAPAPASTNEVRAAGEGGAATADPTPVSASSAREEAQPAPAAETRPVTFVEEVAAPEPEPTTIVVPEDTKLVIRLAHALSSKTAEPGDKFEAVLDEDLKVDGQVVAPAGTTVIGTVVDAKASGKVKGKAQMSIRLSSLKLGSETYRLPTNTLAFEAEGTGKEDAKKVGIGAAVGAVVGAIAGGKKGLGIGTLIGAGAGTGAVLATPGDEVEFAKEQRFQFRLESPVELPLRR